MPPSLRRRALIGAGNLAYAFIELLASSQAVGVMMFGIGFAAAAVVYLVKLND